MALYANQSFSIIRVAKTSHRIALPPAIAHHPAFGIWKRLCLLKCGINLTPTQQLIKADKRDLGNVAAVQTAYVSEIDCIVFAARTSEMDEDSLQDL